MGNTRTTNAGITNARTTSTRTTNARVTNTETDKFAESEQREALYIYRKIRDITDRGMDAQIKRKKDGLKIYESGLREVG